MTELVESDNIKVRFAPSPTGHLHVGGARTALFNYLFARRYGGRLLLRIEDTDRDRSSVEFEKEIIDDLRWLGIHWDEGPIRQSERFDLYREYAEKLLREGKAYFCYCTPEELEAERQKQIAEGKPPRYSGRCRTLTDEQKRLFESEGRRPVIRFRLPDDRAEVKVKDLVRGEVKFSISALDDFIIMRSDGIPTYNFAVVVDDYLMGITDVLRAEEHLPNTPKQVLIYEALGWDVPRFAHVSMILGPDRTKLSKRHGATSISEYRRRGFLPEALVNYLALLGWSSKDSRELFTMEELIDRFSVESLSGSPAVFDDKKLLWMNGHYIRSADIDRITKLCIPYLEGAGYGGVDFERWKKIILVTRDYLSTLSEIPEHVGIFFGERVEVERGAEKYLKYPHVPLIIREFIRRTRDAEKLDADRVLDILRGMLKDFGLSGRKLIMPLRVAITGRTKGPEIYNIVEILGKEVTIKRLENTYKELNADG